MDKSSSLVQWMVARLRRRLLSANLLNPPNLNLLKKLNVTQQSKHSAGTRKYYTQSKHKAGFRRLVRRGLETEQALALQPVVKVVCIIAGRTVSSKVQRVEPQAQRADSLGRFLVRSQLPTT